MTKGGSPLDKLLVLLSITGVFIGAIREVIRLRKGIYHPYLYHWRGENDKGLVKVLVILLILVPPMWIANPDYKSSSYILILFSLLLSINTVNWIFIYRSSVSSMRKTKAIVIQTVALNILLIVALLLLIFSRSL